MKLMQWNLKGSLKMTLQFVVLFTIVGLLYQTRMGYELTTPPEPENFDPPAEVRAGISPKVCVGTVDEQGALGYTKLLCPKNHAILSVSDQPGANKSGPGKFVQLEGLCCPLPSNDILTDEHIYSEMESCPDSYLATGGSGTCGESCTMRCTKINTKKYRLGPEKPSWYVKFKDAGRLHGQGSSERIFWEQITPGLRYGVLRVRQAYWASDGCLGVPFGVMLTSKKNKRCDGFLFRELQYLDGVPVKIIPDCAEISDPYSPNPECLDEANKSKAKQAVIIHKEY